MADALQTPVDRPAGAEVGPALGAARLALMGLGHARDEVVVTPPLARSFAPDIERSAALQLRLQRFRSAYAPLRALS